MPESHDNATPAEALWQPLVDSWKDFVRQAQATDPKAPVAEGAGLNPRALRQQWMDTLSRATDAYLRSPAFLQTMKAHLDAFVKIRPQFAEPRPTAPDDPEAPPVLGQSGELSQRLDRMLTQLQQLELRLDAIGDAADDAGVTCDQVPIPPTGSPLTKGITSHDVVYAEGPLRLLRYRYATPLFREPVLICFALVNRPYILDLQERRSVVQVLLRQGFDVYLIDWGTPSEQDHRLGLEDYICRFLQNVAAAACQRSAAPQLNLLGYCMGGTMSSIFTALHPERVRNLILMAAPIDFDCPEGLLNLWARAEYFDVDGLIDAYGNCPGQFLQYCFQLLKPVQHFAEKYLMLSEHLADAAFLENFFTLERWANDSVPVAGETFREYVKRLYQQNQLVKGDLRLAGMQVKLENITCPLLLLVADRDHLVPARSTLAISAHVGSRDVKSMSVDVGHIGLAVSSQAHRQLWPAAASWIAERSTPSQGEIVT